MPISAANLKFSNEERARMGGLATAAAKRSRGEPMFNAEAQARAGAAVYGRIKSVDRTHRPTMLDIAWAAGIYEGEGNVYRSKKHNSQTVTVGQKDRWLLDRLLALFGGRIDPRAYTDCAAWYCSGARARGFLLTIYSYLSPRRQLQIRAALVR